MSISGTPTAETAESFNVAANTCTVETGNEDGANDRLGRKGINFDAVGHAGDRNAGFIGGDGGKPSLDAVSRLCFEAEL